MCDDEGADGERSFRTIDLIYDVCDVSLTTGITRRSMLAQRG